MITAVHGMAATLFVLGLLVCSARSHNTAGCEAGWFGNKCQFKCRCTNDNCDKEGLCKDKDTCDKGWFGPACQYVDEAYGRATIREVTDGDDHTCILDTTTRRVTLPVVLMFTWLRVHFSTDGFLYAILLRLKYNSTAVVCPVTSNATVDTKTIDIYCPSDVPVQGLVIFGPGVQYICSIYVSGGRNVALKQKAKQSSTYDEVSALTAFQDWFFSAELAVDGNRDQTFYKVRSCSQTKARDPTPGQLIVTLSTPSLINQIVIYNRQNEFASNMVGYLLISYDEAGKEVYRYQDTLIYPLIKYKVAISNLAIASVSLNTSSQNNVLNVCELEMYGDSMCTYGYYGIFCDKMCNCLNGTCFVSTGGCPSGCAAGYWGEDCSEICESGTYGIDCRESCSNFCVKDTDGGKQCDPVSGECLSGCEFGYQPPTCSSVCNPGTYGADCGHECSPYCEKSANNESSCAYTNGTCLHGCVIGYIGATCSISCRQNTYGYKCQSSCSRGCLPSNNSKYVSCHHVTGECLNGCYSDFNGTFCEITLAGLVQAAKFTLGVSNYPIVAIITSSLAFLVAATFCLFFCTKRKRSLRHLQEKE